uniref:Uncharacterized protein n=1 Tax=Anguilla anguilla TaxID=7936 RepID=A0A0E9QP27_ANGAN
MVNKTRLKPSRPIRLDRTGRHHRHAWCNFITHSVSHRRH